MEIYIEWVLDREPHHLPHQSTKSTLETHIYTSSRGPSPCHHHHPATPSPAGAQPARSLAPSLGRPAPERPLRRLDLVAPAATPGRPAPSPRSGSTPFPLPFPPIPFPPRRLPSIHLLLPTGECSGPTETGAQSPPEALPLHQGRPAPEGKRPHAQGRTPWSPLPHRNPRPRRDPPGSPRFPPAPHQGTRPGARGDRRAVPCHAMLDGRLGGPGPCSVARCQATVTLPLRCATRHSTPAHHAHDGAPCLKAPREAKQAHAPAQPLPSCHAIPSTTSTVEDHSHTDSPTLAGLESCAQAFRGPNSILRGTRMDTKWATAGQPAKSSAPLPRCQLARTGAAPPRGPGSTTPPSQTEARAGPPATGQVIRSPPMLPTGKGQGTVESHPLARTRGRRRPRHLLRLLPRTQALDPHVPRGTSRPPAPSTTPSSYPGPPSRPRRQRPTPGPSSQLAKGLGRREPALEHPWCPWPLPRGEPPSKRPALPGHVDGEVCFAQI